MVSADVVNELYGKILGGANIDESNLQWKVFSDYDLICDNEECTIVKFVYADSEGVDEVRAILIDHVIYISDDDGVPVEVAMYVDPAGRPVEMEFVKVSGGRICNKFWMMQE